MAGPHPDERSSRIVARVLSSASFRFDIGDMAGFAQERMARTPLLRGVTSMHKTAIFRGLLVACPSGLASAALCVLFSDSESFNEMLTRKEWDTAWSTFCVLVTFLVVFRTSQAYERFWEGCSACHRLRAEWMDMASCLIAFCTRSGGKQVEVERFKSTLVRVVSFMHGIAMAEIEDRTENVDLEAFDFDLLDPEGFDDDSIAALANSQHKLELLCFWLKRLIMENMESGCLVAPPPILTRAFQELGNGMVAFHDALKVTQIPFPRPYVQACDMMLAIHFVTIPVVTQQWVYHPVMAFLFCFTQVSVLWSLRFTASELENPFGTDANDLDRQQLQQTMNSCLSTLIRDTDKMTPHGDAVVRSSSAIDSLRFSTLRNAFNRLDPSEAISRPSSVSTGVLGRASGLSVSWSRSIGIRGPSVRRWERPSGALSPRSSIVPGRRLNGSELDQPSGVASPRLLGRKVCSLPEAPVSSAEDASERRTAPSTLGAAPPKPQGDAHSPSKCSLSSSDGSQADSVRDDPNGDAAAGTLQEAVVLLSPSLGSGDRDPETLMAVQDRSPHRCSGRILAKLTV